MTQQAGTPTTTCLRQPQKPHAIADIPGQPGAQACALSFIVCRQRGIKIDFHPFNQRVDSIHEVGVDRSDALWVACNIARQETQELTQHRIVLFGCLGTRQHYLFAGAPVLAAINVVTYLHCAWSQP